MKSILVISSFVAGSNVGGSLAMKVFPQLGVDVFLLPTTLLGRHPGWGAPGGGAVPDEMFTGMADGLVANGIPSRCDAVLTGYFASAQQVRLASGLIEAHFAGRVPVIVDPIMGDEGKGLYVREDVAGAIVSGLVPLADVITPNLWEADRLGPTLGSARFVTSVREDDLIGIRGPAGLFAGLPERPAETVSNGTGDLASILIAHELLSVSPEAVDLARIVQTISRQIDQATSGEISAILS